MLNEIGIPEQEPDMGVTVIVDVIAEFVEFVATNDAIFPVPFAANPVVVLSLTHEYAMAFPLNTIAVVD